ncbi:Small heat shock protein C4 [Zancudomyces culisetae]|uniref:Small heat shock protein C4 n=1 Tax=Zancudomyces culisetae TaxID=1213189 RepID=A0A1R1PSE0_ZANCU|nr:Small heat shock protein C4 [Zancudomyces culisetae]|eukprot:OMH83878.1 Small heat shock protein C4 [Zancudomyces culisetae]
MFQTTKDKTQEATKEAQNMTKNAQKSACEAKDQLVDDISKLASQAESKIQEATEGAQKTAGNIQDTAKEKAQEAVKGAQDMAKNAQKSACEARDQVVDDVSELTPQSDSKKSSFGSSLREYFDPFERQLTVLRSRFDTELNDLVHQTRCGIEKIRGSMSGEGDGSDKSGGEEQAEYRLLGTKIMDKLWKPRVDIRESSNKILVQAELPGIPRDKVEAKVEKGLLCIKGTKLVEKLTEGEGRRVQERSCGRFERSFSLPKNIDAANIKANMNNGVLEIEIPLLKTAPDEQVSITIY